MKIHIKNGRLIDPRNGIDASLDVFIAAGRIAAIGTAPKGFAANRTIDASGMIVCPGLVDLAARLREPGFEYMATLESEMEAAIARPTPIRHSTSRGWWKCSSSAPRTSTRRMSTRSAR
jgi:dihydroorotase